MSQGTTKGIPIDTDTSLSANSNALVSSQRAVKTYVESAVAFNLSNATGLPTAGMVDAAVTLAKMANLTGPTVIGKSTGTGVPIALTPAQAWAVTGAKIAIIADQKAQNTQGWTFTSGAWRTRDLNTEIADVDNIVSIAANQFTLAAGNYLIVAHAPALYCLQHQSRLQNITAGTTLAVGESGYATNLAPQIGISSVQWYGTLGVSTVLEIQHQCNTTKASDGFGVANNFTTEQYTTVLIVKVP